MYVLSLTLLQNESAARSGMAFADLLFFLMVIGLGLDLDNIPSTTWFIGSYGLGRIASESAGINFGVSKERREYGVLVFTFIYDRLRLENLRAYKTFNKRLCRIIIY